MLGESLPVRSLCAEAVIEAAVWCKCAPINRMTSIATGGAAGTHHLTAGARQSLCVHSVRAILMTRIWSVQRKRTQTFPSPGDWSGLLSIASSAVRLSQVVAMVSLRDCCWTIGHGSHRKDRVRWCQVHSLEGGVAIELITGTLLRSSQWMHEVHQLN